MHNASYACGKQEGLGDKREQKHVILLPCARARSQPVNHQTTEKPRLEMSLYDLYSKETLHMEIQGEARA